jgi:hypothetical protein
MATLSATLVFVALPMLFLMLAPKGENAQFENVAEEFMPMLLEF